MQTVIPERQRYLGNRKGIQDGEEILHQVVVRRRLRLRWLVREPVPTPARRRGSRRRPRPAYDGATSTKSPGNRAGTAPSPAPLQQKRHHSRRLALSLSSISEKKNGGLGRGANLDLAGEQEKPLPAWATWRLRPRMGRWLCSTCCSMFMAISALIQWRLLQRFGSFDLSGVGTR